MKLARINVGSISRQYRSATSLKKDFLSTFYCNDSEFHNSWFHDSTAYCLDAVDVMPAGSVVANKQFPNNYFAKMTRRT